MSSGAVTRMVISSAYATTAAFLERRLILIPVSVCSNTCCMGFKLNVNRNMLIGHPCRTEQRMGMGPARCPLICSDGVAWSYVCLMRVIKPQLLIVLKRYVCEIL
jgi:hypothetical protein